MNIGEAADRAGMAAKTIRYYESAGLIEPAARAGNNYRDYGAKDVETLRFIHRARGLGFSIADIAGLLALYRDKSRSSHDVKTIAERQIVSIGRKIAELEAMRATLQELARRCHGDERPDCPILADLAGPDGAEAGNPAAASPIASARRRGYRASR